MSRYSSYLLICWCLAASVMAMAETPEPSKTLQTATFSMYCYWTGEATLGRVDGVVASRIGHWSGKEIVQVDFDPQRTSVEQLASALRRGRSLYAVVIDREEASPANIGPQDVERLSGEPHFIEPKHSLRTRYPKLAALDLTEAQAIALNAWSYFGGPMPDVLTDAQKKQLREE